MASKKDISQDIVIEVWKKAKPVDGVNPDQLRQDYAGAWIRFVDYGNRDSQYGWEIDHLKPLSMNGTDVPDNCLPLQWQNNVSKGNDYPRWTTAMTSDGQNNVEFVKYWKINE